MRPLIEDFPSQFKGKPKIEALCACFDRQFAEIEQCFQQLLLLLLLGGADAHRRAEHQAGEKNGGEFWFDGHIEYLP